MLTRLEPRARHQPQHGAALKVPYFHRAVIGTGAVESVGGAEGDGLDRRRVRLHLLDVVERHLIWGYRCSAATK